jgi:hypothetical protein
MLVIVHMYTPFLASLLCKMFCVPLTEDPPPGLHGEAGEDVGPTQRGLPHHAGNGGDRTGDHGQSAERQRDH